MIINLTETQPYTVISEKSQQFGPTKYTSYVLVPPDDLATLERYETAVKTIPPVNCTHTDIEGIELLPDVYICTNCHQLLTMETNQHLSGSAGYVPMNADQLEAAIFDALQPSLEAINEVLSAASHLKDISDWSEGLWYHNEILKERARKKREEDNRIWERVQARLRENKVQAVTE